MSPEHDHPYANHRAERGFTFVELAFSMLIMVAVAMTLVQHVSGVYKRNTKHNDRVRAHAIASSILSELQSYVNITEGTSANSLNVFDDGTSNNPVLTIMKEGGSSVAPDHPLSKNTLSNGEWSWSRRVTVRPFPGLNNRNVRYVTVKVFRRKRASGDWERLADLSGVVNSVGSSYPPSQVFDVYLLALENIPGWWVHMDAIRPFVEASITDLEARNPGCKIRTHWITKASYGRNPTYTPYVNATNDSKQPIPGVYFYPGKMPSGAASNFYYVPETMQARMLLDGVLSNGYDVADNPLPYAFADRFNAGMRYEDERRYFERRVTAGLEDPDVPTWRLLLEDMAREPDRYHNAILVNLHGELLPMPSMRNYSDAAKSPILRPGLRVVTHPERLWTKRSPTAGLSNDVYFRVYAYRTEPDSPADKFTNSEPIALQIMDANLTGNINGAGVGQVTLEVTGVDGGPGGDAYTTFGTLPQSPSTGMWFEAKYVDDSATTGEKYTLILLHNTPSICPPVAGQGLATTDRLYGYEYIPCTTEAANSFAKNLTSTLSGPKNTARWRIKLPGEVLGLTGTELALADKVLEVRTRIGDDLTTGAMYPTANDPENLTRTYAYWLESKEGVPHTERAQFQGDPRHMPYADLKQGSGASFAHGYNWFFDDFVNGSNDARSRWQGFDTGRLRDGWRGKIEADYGRYAELIRKAITNSEAIYTTLTGFSYYYMGLGNEIGSDSANGYPSSIPTNLLPYGASSGWGYVHNIGSGSGRRGQKVIRSTAGGSALWWGRYWLGELYPDSMAATWSAFGNLPSGNAANQFYRIQPYDLGTTDMPYGTRMFRSHRTTQEEGCVSVFNIGTHSSTFHHVFSSGTGSIVGAGNDLANNYNFPMPTSAPINRPFGLTQSYHGWVGDEFWYTGDYPHFSAAVERTYYQQGSLQGSALVGLTTPDGSKTGHIVVNGLSQTVESGSGFIAKYAVLSLLHSFFEAGHPAFANALTPLPRVEVLHPTEISELDNVTTIALSWQTDWRRWDGRKYSSAYSDTFVGNESNLDYVLTYSRDGGQTWLYVQDDTPAVSGKRPTNATYIVADGGTGDESRNWLVPADRFPEGTYILRVECYRRGESMHYSYHQSSFYLQR